MSANAISRPARLGLIAGLVTFVVLAGTVAGYAYWSGQATGTTGIGAANVTVTSSGMPTQTLANESVTAAGALSLATTGSVTFTNTTTTTSTQSQALRVVFSRASGSAAMAGAVTLTVWEVAAATSCTDTATPTSPTSAPWSAGVTVNKTLAPGAAVTYCLRSSTADRQNVSSASGSLSFVPQAAATLTSNSFTGTATPTGTVATRYIYPPSAISSSFWYNFKRAAPEMCWDVTAASTTSGSAVISFACKNDAGLNQDFRLTDDNGDGYGDLQPRHATALRIDQQSSNLSGATLLMITTSAGGPSQSWQPQLVSAGVYQLVSRYSGLCLNTSATSTAPLTQVTCNGSADQRFTLTQRATAP